MKFKKTPDIFNLYFKKNIPFEAVIELTEFCNFKCKHCNRIAGKNFLTLTQFEYILEELKKLSTIKLFFTGGEPTLHPQIMEIIKLTIEHKFQFSIQTNLSNMTDELIQLLNRTKYCTSIQISLYGSSEKVYSAVTGRKKIFHKIENRLEYLRKIKKVKILKLLISNLNFTDCWNMLKFGKQFTKKCFIDFGITQRDDNGCSDNCSNLRVPLDSYKNFLDNLFSKYTKNKIKFLVSLNNRKLNRKKILNSNVCNAGISKICITATGELLACNALRISFGNIFKKNLSDIWKNSGKLNKLRKLKLNQISKCRDCKIIDNCKVRCIGMFYSENRSLMKPFAYRCKLNKIYLEILKKYDIIKEENLYKPKVGFIL